MVVGALVGREDGTPAPVPKGSEVPPAIAEALRTGMAPDPAQRHADLTALLQALEAPPNRRLGWIAAMVAVASIAAAAVALRSTAPDSSEPTAVTPIVTECSLSFDDSRRSMRDSLALAEEEMADATLTVTLFGERAVAGLVAALLRLLCHAALIVERR